MVLSELDHVSLEMDEKLLLYMDQLELLEEKRTSLNALIEQGWFSISKARYSMGNKQVSSLQYASEIEPLTCIHTQSLASGEITFSTDKVDVKADDSLRPVEDIGFKDTGVRRRNQMKSDVDEREGSEKSVPKSSREIQKLRKSDHSSQQDPLKWFGILVPQSLKQAQTSFKQVIELSTEIASLQTAILNTREELRKDMEQKAKIQGTASTLNKDQEGNS